MLIGLYVASIFWTTHLQCSEGILPGHTQHRFPEMQLNTSHLPQVSQYDLYIYLHTHYWSLIYSLTQSWEHISAVPFKDVQKQKLFVLNKFLLSPLFPK